MTDERTLIETGSRLPPARATMGDMRTKYGLLALGLLVVLAAWWLLAGAATSHPNLGGVLDLDGTPSASTASTAPAAEPTEPLPGPSAGPASPPVPQDLPPVLIPDPPPPVIVDDDGGDDDGGDDD